MSTYSSPTRTRMQDLPIEVDLHAPVLDLGMTSVPAIFLYFYPHLVSRGERLTDGEAMQILQYLDPGIRLARQYNPYKFYRMGLIFPFARQPGKPVVLDFRSLFYNLEQIARVWKIRQDELLTNWYRSGQNGYRPFYSMPREYRHEVILSLQVARDIVSGVLHPVPARWVDNARQMKAQAGGG